MVLISNGQAIIGTPTLYLPKTLHSTQIGFLTISSNFPKTLEQEFTKLYCAKTEPEAENASHPREEVNDAEGNDAGLSHLHVLDKGDLHPWHGPSVLAHFLCVGPGDGAGQFAIRKLDTEY